MLVLPLLALPFVTLAFWALGGGRGTGDVSVSSSGGLNMNLPGAKAEEGDMADKLSFYDRAAKDSAKRSEYRQADPFYKPSLQDSAIGSDLESSISQATSRHNQDLNPSPNEDNGSEVERTLTQKLAQLQRQLNTPASPTQQVEPRPAAGSDAEDVSKQMDRLQGMMENMSGEAAEDGEMRQLNSTLDKILDIQHPERMADRMKAKSVQQKEKAFPVRTKLHREVVGMVDTPRIKTKTTTGFFGLTTVNAEDAEGNVVEAMVAEAQVVVEGAVIQLRLATDVFINGTLVPRGTALNGITRLNGERLEAEIKSIRHGNAILAVQMELYDLDGLPGIYVPGSISRDVAKQSTDNSLQLLEIATLDPSLKAQAASAGLGAAKSLLSRKVKQVRVSVKAGYKVLLKGKDEN